MWSKPSPLVQVTLVPALTVIVCGLKAKPLMLTLSVLVAPAEAALVDVDPAVVGVVAVVDGVFFDPPHPPKAMVAATKPAAIARFTECDTNGHVTRGVLVAKLGYTLLEAMGGLVLLIAGVTHHDLVAAAHRAAARQLHDDPGAFWPRLVLHFRSERPLSAVKEWLTGSAVITYAAVKAGVVIGILRRSRVMIQVGAVLFTLLSLAAMGALLRHPSVPGMVVVVLDLAVAVVVIVEARRVLRLH